MIDAFNKFKIFSAFEQAIYCNIVYKRDVWGIQFFFKKQKLLKFQKSILVFILAIT